MFPFTRGITVWAMAVLSTASWACDEHLPVRGGITASASGDRSIEITNEADGKFRIYVDEHDVPLSVKAAKAQIDIQRDGKVRSHPMQPTADSTAVVLNGAQIKHGDMLRVVINLPNRQAIVSELRYTGMNPIAQAVSMSSKPAARAR